MGRNPCCSKDQGLNKGAWTAMEDKILTEYINLRGEGKWRNIPKLAGLKRCGKSCRLRWLNYLRPDIKRGNITQDEEDLIFRLHKLLGNRWSLIAGRLPGRTDNEIKNYWNTVLSKKAKEEPNPQCFNGKIVAKQASTALAAPRHQNDTKSSDDDDSANNPRPEGESSDDKSCGHLPDDFGIDFNQLIGGINLSEFLNSDDYSELESDMSPVDDDRQLNLDAGFGSLELFLESGDQGWII